MYQHESTEIKTSKEGHGFVAKRIGRLAANHTEQRCALGKGGANHNAHYSTCDSVLGAHAKTETEGSQKTMSKNMRGMGRVYPARSEWAALDFVLSPRARDSGASENQQRGKGVKSAEAALGRDAD